MPKEIMEVYEPREDTFLLLKQVRRYAKGFVLDMGTGTGLLAIEAAKQADYVLGVDINEEALRRARANAYGIENIEFVRSDLFEIFRKEPKRFPNRFDLIIFNPPYLPEHKGEQETIKAAISGGKHGYEILDRFFKDVSEFLKQDGKVLIVFSTLTGLNHVHDILERYAFKFQKLSEKQLAFETLFVYIAEKSAMLRELERRGIKYIKRFAKGHRGLLFKGVLDSKVVAIKKQREDIAAIGRIQNEARWLRFLNRHGIGPKLLFAMNNFFVYEFVHGEFIPDYLERADAKSAMRVLKDVLLQLRLLDKIKVNKEEMHHPPKHIVVNEAGIPVLLDFERTHAVEKPKNVTQFCQYIASRAVQSILSKKGVAINAEGLRKLAAAYKRKPSAENFERILKFITS